MSEDRIESSLRPLFHQVVLDVRKAMKEEGVGKWTALEAAIPSFISIAPKSSWIDGFLSTHWIVEAQITPTHQDQAEYLRKQVLPAYPTEQDMYDLFMFFRNQGPWCAAKACHDLLRALFKAGV